VRIAPFRTGNTPSSVLLFYSRKKLRCVEAKIKDVDLLETEWLSKVESKTSMLHQECAMQVEGRFVYSFLDDFIHEIGKSSIQEYYKQLSTRTDPTTFIGSEKILGNKSNRLKMIAVYSFIKFLKKYQQGHMNEAWHQLILASSWSSMASGWRKFVAFGSRGGKAHHADDRQAFWNDYRAGRDDVSNKFFTRPKLIESLKKYYLDVPGSTLAKWAKQADHEDGFVRKGGRPKKG